MRSTLVAVLVAACAGGDATLSAVVRPQPDEPFTLSLGQTAVLAEPVVTITFTAVPHDSRCPVDVVCVWAGDAVVRLTLHAGPPDGDGPDVDVDLHVSQEPRTAPVGPSYLLRLVSLDPQPRLDPPPTEPYRATLVLESQ